MWTCPRCGKHFVTRNMWHSCVRVERPEDLDGQVRRWLREAYKVGKQEHLLG